MRGYGRARAVPGNRLVQGERLYRDATYYYGPLGAWTNALALFLFGNRWLVLELVCAADGDRKSPQRTTASEGSGSGMPPPTESLPLGGVWVGMGGGQGGGWHIRMVPRLAVGRAVVAVLPAAVAGSLAITAG